MTQYNGISKIIEIDRSTLGEGVEGEGVIENNRNRSKHIGGGGRGRASKIIEIDRSILVEGVEGRVLSKIIEIDQSTLGEVVEGGHRKLSKSIETYLEGRVG